MEIKMNDQLLDEITSIIGKTCFPKHSLQEGEVGLTGAESLKAQTAAQAVYKKIKESFDVNT
jgi:hypothetical protein